MECLGAIEESVKNVLDSMLPPSEDVISGQFKHALLGDDHVRPKFSTIMDLKYFPKTKFLCFQVLSPWKL